MISELQEITNLQTQPLAQSISIQLLSLQQIFSKPQLNAIELLSHDNLIQELKKDSTLFTDLFIKHPNSQIITKEMFKIIIRPESMLNFYNVAPGLQNVNINVMKEKITYRCIEVLTNQDEQFLIFVIRKKQKSINKCQINNNKMEIQAKQPTINLQQQKNSTQNNQKTNSVSSLLDYLFNLLQQQIKKSAQTTNEQYNSISYKTQLQETSLAYFAKIIQQYLYNRASLIINYLYNLQSDSLQQESNENERFVIKPIQKIVKHIYSRSISELLNRIFQAEGKDQEFYIRQKIDTFVFIQKSILDQIHLISNQELENQESIESMQACLQNFNSMIQNLIDKCEDRQQKARYLQFLKQLINHQIKKQLPQVENVKDQKKSNIITNLVHFMENQSLKINSGMKFYQQKDLIWIKNYLKSIFQSIMKVLNSFIKLDQCFHRTPKQKSISQGNMSSKKKFDTSQQSVSQVNSYDLKLEPQIILQIQQKLIFIFEKQTKNFLQKQQEKCQKLLWDYIQEQPIIMVTYFQLLRSIMLASLSFNFFTRKSNILRLLQLIEKNPQKNILHNSIKEIFILYFKRQQKAKLIQFFFKGTQKPKQLEEESIVMKHIIKNLQKGTNHTYEIQIVQIGKLLLSKIEVQDLTNQKEIQSFQALKTLINNKNDFYNKIIGSDPRKTSENWGDDSSELVFAGQFQNYQKPNVHILEQKQQILGNLSSDIKMQTSTDFIQTNQNHWVEDQGVALDSQHSLSEDNSLSKDQKLMNEFNIKNTQINLSNQKDSFKFEKILNDELSLNLSLSFNQQKQKDKQLSASKEMQKQWLKITKNHQMKILQKQSNESLQSIAMKFKNSSMEFDISQIADQLQKI